jgi:hypothetical protein
MPTQNVALLVQGSILDFTGQPAAPSNPPVGQARAYYNSTTDQFLVLDSLGNNIMVAGSVAVSALPSGTTATTNANAGDLSTAVATDQFVQQAIDYTMATLPLNLGSGGGGTYSFSSLGTGGKANVTAVSGAITNVLVWIPIGNGYVVGDLVTIGGGNYDSIIRITGVNGSGQPTGGTILYGGTGYVSGTGNAASAVQSVPFTITLTGTLTSNATFLTTYGSYILTSNQYIVCNNTTGAYSVTFAQAGSGNTASGGRTVVIPQGTNNTSSVFISTDGVLNLDLAIASAHSTTTGRPTPNGVGQMDFDTTLGIPIWWNGSNWVNSVGVSV